jgi:predicted polyphosphate/ATP-dependent NAD kinase
LLAALGLEGSLLGVDALCDGGLQGSDPLPAQMLDLLARHERRHLVLTATDGQGFLIGRGNQQLTPDVLRAVGPDGLLLVATPGKLARLDGRPLLVDSGDPALDVSLAGLREVVTGYEQSVLYRVQPAWQTVAGDA